MWRPSLDDLAGPVFPICRGDRGPALSEISFLLPTEVGCISDLRWALQAGSTSWPPDAPRPAICLAFQPCPLFPGWAFQALPWASSLVPNS